MAGKEDKEVAGRSSSPTDETSPIHEEVRNELQTDLNREVADLNELVNDPPEGIERLIDRLNILLCSPRSQTL